MDGLEPALWLSPHIGGQLPGGGVRHVVKEELLLLIEQVYLNGFLACMQHRRSLSLSWITYRLEVTTYWMRLQDGLGK